MSPVFSAQSQVCGWLIDACLTISSGVVVEWSTINNTWRLKICIAWLNKVLASMFSAKANWAMTSTVGVGVFLVFEFVLRARSSATTYGCEIFARWASSRVDNPS